MDWPAIGSFIKDVGFPIGVAVFVLYRLNGQMAGLTSAMRSLEKTFITVGEAMTLHRDEARDMWRETRARWEKDARRRKDES